MPDDKRSNISTGARIAIGAGIGAALSSATGSPVWIAVGVALVAATGRAGKRDRDDTDE